MLQLYGHPFSSYTWKVLIALDELGLDFDFRILTGAEDGVAAEFAALATLGKFPVLVDDGLILEESSTIIDHLGLHHDDDRRLIPMDEEDALLLRQFDRVCDLYVMNPMQEIVGDFMRQPEQRNADVVLRAKAVIDKGYRWLDQRLEPESWASGWDFTIADCSAAPALFYADWVHPISATLPKVSAYRARLLSRPSVAKAVDAARPYRSIFPPGAPDRD